MTGKRLTADDVEFSLICEQEQVPYVGNCLAWPALFSGEGIPMHDKGPWTIQHDEEPRNLAPQVAVVGPLGYAVALCGRTDSREENDNARLIAAAPDLLAACDKAESELERMEAATGKPVAEDVILAIRAALAKARGERATA